MNPRQLKGTREGSQFASKPAPDLVDCEEMSLNELTKPPEPPKPVPNGKPMDPLAWSLVGLVIFSGSLIVSVIFSGSLVAPVTLGRLLVVPTISFVLLIVPVVGLAWSCWQAKQNGEPCRPIIVGIVIQAILIVDLIVVLVVSW